MCTPCTDRDIYDRLQVLKWGINGVTSVLATTVQGSRMGHVNQIPLTSQTKPTIRTCCQQTINAVIVRRTLLFLRRVSLTMIR